MKALSQPQPGQYAVAALVISQARRPGFGLDRRLTFLGFWLALLLSVAVLLGGCKDQEIGWDPDIAVKVNGRPVPRAALERVLEWGFYPDLDQGGEREINIPLILDKLINEELILDEAQKAGLIVSASEVDEELDGLASAWFGVDPPRPDQAEFRQALSRHLLLRKMTEKVISEKRVLSADKWRKFWEKWPKNRAPAFRVRAVLLSPADDEPEWPAEIRTLSQVADYFRSEGQAVIVSQSLWISGDNLDQVVSDELSRSYRERRLSLPIRLDESWAVYEVMTIDSGPEAAEEFEFARKAFEARSGEETFQKWLSEIRASAKIEYSPSLGLPEAAPK